jgi:hypothetical protein
MKATRTPPMAPAPPTNLRPVASGTTQTAIRVEWDAPAGTPEATSTMSMASTSLDRRRHEGETLTDSPRTQLHHPVSATIGGSRRSRPSSPQRPTPCPRPHLPGRCTGRTSSTALPLTHEMERPRQLHLWRR